MLERLRIRNFQCHEKLDLQLDPKVTVLTGPSDVGKSAVLRALRWVMTDRPKGDAFVREGAERASVVLELDGRKLGRLRKGRENLYRLDSTEYRAWGSTPPEPIEQLVNVDEVNFQGQHDPVYWLHLSAAEVARRLNAIVDLSLIDRLVQSMQRRIRMLRTKVDLTQGRLEEVQTRVDLLEEVPAMEEEYTELVVDRDWLFTRDGKTAALIRLADTVFKQGKKVEEGAEARIQGSDLIQFGQGIKKLYQCCLSMEEILQRIDRVRRLMGQCEQIRQAWISLEEQGEELKQLWDRYYVLQRVLSELHGQDQYRERMAVQIEQLREQLEQENEGRCPVCQSPLTF